MLHSVPSVEYWRCVELENELLLYMVLGGHDRRPHRIRASLADVAGTPLGSVHEGIADLKTDLPSVEIIIPARQLPAGSYRLLVTIDEHSVGIFPCELKKRRGAVGPACD